MIVTKLKKYVRQECANYQSHYDICIINEKPCLLSENKRCPYFEKVIFPIAAQQGVLNKVRIWYEMKEKSVRSCPDCGAELAYRKRYCNRCSKKRKRTTQRRS